VRTDSVEFVVVGRIEQVVTGAAVAERCPSGCMDQAVAEQDMVAERLDGLVSTCWCCCYTWVAVTAVPGCNCSLASQSYMVGVLLDHVQLVLVLEPAPGLAVENALGLVLPEHVVC